jgi:hypothetical protein
MLIDCHIAVKKKLTKQIVYFHFHYSRDFSAKLLNNSIGIGKIIVEFFSAAIPDRVCRYLSWRAIGFEAMISAAALNATDALCSPSAATTLALASLAASASVAIDRCIEVGRLTSFLKTIIIFKLLSFLFKTTINLQFNAFDFDAPLVSGFI